MVYATLVVSVSDKFVGDHFRVHSGRVALPGPVVPPLHRARGAVNVFVSILFNQCKHTFFIDDYFTADIPQILVMPSMAVLVSSQHSSAAIEWPGPSHRISPPDSLKISQYGARTPRSIKHVGNKRLFLQPAHSASFATGSWARFSS